MNKRVLITGGCGFIGSNFIRHILTKYPYHVVNFDKLTYAGNPENLDDVKSDPRYEFVKGDIAERSDLKNLFAEKIDMIVNFAAESHVDRSIVDPDSFIRTNIGGTFQLLEIAKATGVERFLQVSTDEVYGSLGKEGKFREDTPLAPNSPYSASKTSADVLAMSYYKTYGLPVLITRCSNNYGPYQFPEKLIPLIITNALNNIELPVYGDGMNVRDWIHVQDHCEAIDTVLHKGKDGAVYNIGGENERTNMEIIRTILNILNRPESLIRYVKDRPGHDRRYAIDSTKVKTDLGFTPRKEFKTGMEETVRWYMDNTGWWERIKSGQYMEYYKNMYGNR